MTNLAQYAVRGYSVSAFDYIVRPVAYQDFALKMARALRKLSGIKAGPEVIVYGTQGESPALR